MPNVTNLNLSRNKITDISSLKYSMPNVEHLDLNNNNIVKYLNRLSDYLFVLSRFYNKNNHIDENMWKK